VVDVLELAPSRTVPWREGEDGLVVIDRPRPRVRGLRDVIASAGWLLTPRRIHLDEIGSFAWRRLDGATTLRTLAQVMRDAFPDSCEQLEERLGAYVRNMQRMRLISFPDLD
jgi:hypothetical protein